MRFLFAGLDLERLYEYKTYDAKNDGNRKDDGVAKGFVKEHAGHGACCKGQVYADAEVPDAFTATAGRERVNGDGVACCTRNPEEEPVRKTYHRKDR